MEFALLALIFLFSTFVQGFTSFGFSLVSIPLLMLIVDDMPLIVVVTISFSFVINSIVIRKYYKHAKLKKILPLLITAILFTFIGVSFLQTVNEFLLKLIIGILLIVVGIVNIFGIKFRLKKPEILYIPVGMISGILNGISGVSGPPVLIFLSNIDLGKNEFKATLSSYFFTLNIVAISSFMYKGYYTPNNIKFILSMLPFVIVGSSFGVFLSTKVSEKIFKLIINIIIPVMGINMIVRLFV